MIELFQITNDPAMVRRCAAMDGIRIFVDLERTGKAERQAGRNTFISTHQLDDVARVKSQAGRCRVMVRVNPLDAGTPAEVDVVLAHGADMLMLPMFTDAAQIAGFCSIVAGRVPVVPLLETSGALASLGDWIDTPGVAEIFIGLNDLHVSLGCRFMFEPLALGHIDRVAAAARSRGLPFGFGGIAQMDGGLLAGRDVLAEHARLGSRAVILSRTFHGTGAGESFEQQVGRLRDVEQVLARRSAAQVEADRVRIHASIDAIARRVVAP